jgi:tRNA splicing ligase
VKSKVVLLDIVYNEIPFRKMPFDEMTAVADRFSIPHKELAYTLESWQEFFDWQNQVTAEGYQYKGREIEGFVIEGANGYMVKLKLAYYRFWKFMRGIAYETIKNGYVSKDKLAGLQSACGNFFYGWLKEYREQLLAANDDPDMDKREILSQIPTDIITLRRMFLDSGYMNEHH